MLFSHCTVRVHTLMQSGCIYNDCVILGQGTLPTIVVSELNRCCVYNITTVVSSAVPVTVSHCSFDSASLDIRPSSEIGGAEVVNCVFDDSSIVTNQAAANLMRLKNCFYFNGQPLAVSYEESAIVPNQLTALAASPFADAAGGDWTPSAELSSHQIANLTPGAVQAASSGTAGFTGIRGLSRRLG